MIGLFHFMQLLFQFNITNYKYMAKTKSFMPSSLIIIFFYATCATFNTVDN